MPLYTRVMKETARLTDYLQTVDGTNNSHSDSSEVVQFANLYLRKLLTELESPRQFFHLGHAPKRDVKPKRKNAAYTARYIAENLHALYERIDINDLHAFHAGSAKSRLYNNLLYYRMALQMVANTLEGNSSLSLRADSAKKRLHKLRVKSDRLVLIPQEVVDQFNEKEYLLANMDVRASLAEGNISCGMEHFVMQGVQEAKLGGRLAPGVDLDLIKDDSGTQSPSQIKHNMACIEASGLFDADWYKKHYGKTRYPLQHYCTKGFLAGNAPNAFFDQDWYCKHYGVELTAGMPLVHYIEQGEAAGYMPCERFEPAWYKSHHNLSDSNGLALTHYLREGRDKSLSPNSIIDLQYYAEQNPDVLKANMKPVDHFYLYGWKEHRAPSASFDALTYKNDVLKGALDINPVTHALLQKTQPEELLQSDAMHSGAGELGGLVESVTDKDLPSLGDIAGNIKYFANPGPDFEGPSTVDCSALKAKAKTIAFYLPQFHAFEDNDNWWGTGFTEWRNVARGTPRYAGHYQPRIPRDLGFYDLNDESVLHRQSEMALENGIEAFCFYYYWFNGKRLMDKPLDMFANADIDQEFCIMFANENWTRTWDGFDSEVLIEQDYRDEDEDDFIEDTAQYFRNERYTRVNGRPLFIIYRPGLLPKSKATLARWRKKWKAAVGIEPWMLMVQGFGDEDPREFGLDGAVEFPPHKICKDMPNMHDQLTILDPNYEGYAKAYTDIIERSLGEKPPEFPLIKTVVPHWDNDARREGRGFTMHGSTPALYESWLQGAVKYANENPFEEEPLVFINAWNEWAEGAYLEPDVHYGHAYLNATRRAVHGLTNAKHRQKLLLVGHDAYKHGAQMLLMSLAKTYTRQFGLDVTILLRDSGPLVDDYREVCRTVVLTQLGKDNLEGWARHEGFDIAVCNTTVTGDLLPDLTRAGLEVVSLIHELPNLIKEHELEGNIPLIAKHAKHTIFPSNIVQDGFNQFVDTWESEEVIRPQGLYMPIEYSQKKRDGIRAELGIPSDAKVVLNVGFADLRKGFDLFLQVARQMVADRADVHFVWAGAIDQDMERWVQSDLDAALAKRIHLVGFTKKMVDYYSASDCLFLSSREDPYPSVVLEAMCVGAPVVIFKGATGFDKLISEYGQVVDRNEPAQITRAIVHCLYNDSRAEKLARAEYVDEHCRFDDYCFDLLQMLKPDLKKVSVVVPNYNYAEYMSSRLNSVFDQTYPVFETIVLDDCSKDDSVEVIGDVAENAQRIIEVAENEENSGNVFHQWKKGVSSCRGDIVWIAEADDLSQPDFIARSLELFDDETVLSFSNSKQIGTDNEELAKDYNYYYRQVDPSLFHSDFRLNGKDFIQRAMSVRNVIMNVSSVLWSREALNTALETVGDDLFDMKLVGDWRLYLEVLSQSDANVAYVSDSLNTHRRHQESVTHSLDRTAHLNEIKRMHRLVNDLVESDFTIVQEMEAYVDELMEQFELKPTKRKAAA
ncbi:MAG: glycoside hydrolase family 99-like domain-containing protein [Gammaproteobacteria bacterium]|nr:glycoside hydrolase family 99-like domain-containing protein [Gammaproteobacteria bacterium]